jgi:hypothetical protein
MELADQGPTLRAALAEEVAELLSCWPADYEREIYGCWKAVRDVDSHLAASGPARSQPSLAQRVLRGSSR